MLRTATITHSHPTSASPDSPTDGLKISRAESEWTSKELSYTQRTQGRRAGVRAGDTELRAQHFCTSAPLNSNKNPTKTPKPKPSNQNRSAYTCGGQRTTGKGWTSLSAMWDPRVDLGSSGLVTGTFSRGRTYEPQEQPQLDIPCEAGNRS